MKRLVLFGAQLLCGCEEESNPVKDAINAGSFDLSVADYKAGMPEDRAVLIEKYMTESNLPSQDQTHYVACMGDYAANKSETLAFKEIFAWCQGDADNNHEEFEGHFNELDAAELSAQAAVMCKTYVKTKLTAPGTADFPWAMDTTSKGEWQYVVSSYVDAQNGFGGEVRTYFMCDMQYGGPDEVGEHLNYQHWTMHGFDAHQ